MEIVTLLAFYIITPILVVWLCEKNKFMGKIGPILLLYAVGIIVGNMPFFPHNCNQLQDAICSVIIPIAIPMLLFNCNFRGYSIKQSLVALLTGIVAVTVAVVCGFFIFKSHLGAEGAKIGGALTGVYTGGTPNLAALKLMLNLSNETYIIINSYDILVSFLYLTFVLSAGIPLFRRILNPAARQAKCAPATDCAVEQSAATQSVFIDHSHRYTKKQSAIQILTAASLSILIFAISGGVALLLPQTFFMAAVILLLTTLGIAASFIPRVRAMERSFDGGMFLIYIFSLVVASMANLAELDFGGGLYLLFYLLFVVFVSLFLQTILARIFHIDADTMLISSVALINSPPFVPMIASAMKNRDVIAIGLGVGVIGYAAGNYLGFAIAHILNIL